VNAVFARWSSRRAGHSAPRGRARTLLSTCSALLAGLRASCRIREGSGDDNRTWDRDADDCHHLSAWRVERRPIRKRHGSRKSAAALAAGDDPGRIATIVRAFAVSCQSTGASSEPAAYTDPASSAIEWPVPTDALAALQAASDACHAAPERPEAHYAYGQAWSALGNHRNVERAFAEAIRLAPRWTDAWVNYGVARYRQGHIEDAKTAMRQALLGTPGHAAAAANLGGFMQISGESEASEALLLATIARDPSNVAA
jgi:tetratricopeptide (TPR) repeat protein